MRVAIPVSDGRIDQILDCATSLVVLDLRDDGRGEYFETSIHSLWMKDRAREFAAMGIDVLLCNEVSHSLESLIRDGGIEVRTHHSGTVDEVIESFFVRYNSGERSWNNRPPAPTAVLSARASHQVS